MILLLGNSILPMVCVFLHQYHTVLITVSVQYILKSGNIMLFLLFSLLKIVVGTWGFLLSHIDLGIDFFSSSVKSVGGILIGITLNL